MKKRSNNAHWFLLHSGHKFWPLDPRVEDVRLVDIAHGLAHICRFGGHCRRFYSVAQHSIIVSRNLPAELKMFGLLHDATEAYIGDMIRPLKIQMPQFNRIESKLWKVIAAKFRLPKYDPRDNPLLKEADDRALLTERRDLFRLCRYQWAVTAEPFDERIVPMEPAEAETAFLNEFLSL